MPDENKPRRNLDDLRDKLFDTLDALGNQEKPMELDRAKAVADIAQVIINSAKVEVDYARVTGKKGGDFLESKQALPPGITGTTIHKMR